MDTPIKTAHLFAELNDHLVTMLRSLKPDDWHKPTVCSQWNVKDIAAHLLDGAVRRLAFQRDGYYPPGGPTSFGSHDELMAYLNRLNSDWTQATRRISPRTLIEMLAFIGLEVADMFVAADPNAPALFSVAWAGESESKMWFDIAREYTERWHHQRQIADAVGAFTPIDARRLYFPVLETFMRALPFTFRDTTASNGAAVCVQVTGEAGGKWFVQRQSGKWQLARDAECPVAMLTMPQEIAWKILTKRRDAETKLRAFPGIQIEGDAALARRAVEMVSIMA